MGSKNKVSKNSRTQSKGDSFICHCGGTIVVKVSMIKGRMHKKAVCTSCTKEAAKPRFLMK